MLSSRAPILGKSSFDPQFLNSMLPAARRDVRVDEIQRCGGDVLQNRNIVLRRNTVMVIAGLSSRHIRTCRETRGIVTAIVTRKTLATVRAAAPRRARASWRS